MREVCKLSYSLRSEMKLCTYRRKELYTDQSLREGTDQAPDQGQLYRPVPSRSKDVLVAVLGFLNFI